MFQGGTEWIGFWGSYVGALIGSAIPLYVLRRTLQFERKREASQKRRTFSDSLLQNVSALIALQKATFAAKQYLQKNNGQIAEAKRYFNETVAKFWEMHQYIKLRLEVIQRSEEFPSVDLLLDQLEEFAKLTQDYIQLNSVEEELWDFQNVGFRVADTTNVKLLNSTKDFVRKCLHD